MLLGNDRRHIKHSQQAGSCRLPPGRQMLWGKAMPPCHLGHDCTRRKGFRHDPGLHLVAPTATSGPTTGSEASTIWSTIYATRSVQDRSHVAGHLAAHN